MAEAIEPIGTYPDKSHQEITPWLSVVFYERYGRLPNGAKQKNYYVPKSVGIATGFLISALHSTGLSCLVHTPCPVGFLTRICAGPTFNKATLLLAVGHSTDNPTFPCAAKVKIPLSEIVSTS